MNLYLHDIFSHNFKHYQQTANGLVVRPRPEPFTYRGYTNNQSNQNLAIAIKEDWISGFFIYQNQRYYLTPLKQFDSSFQNNNSVVLYIAEDSKHPSFDCGVGKSMDQLDIPSINKPNELSKNSVVVECTEMAVAYDQGFKNLHGGNQGAENILASRLNMVANLYTNWFEIDYKIIEFHEAALNEITPENNFESCQEVFPNCSDGTILDDFREWGEGQAQSPNFGSGFNTNPDVATFWTSRDIIDGTNGLNIGYSHFAGICNNRGYNICEDAVRYRGNEPMQMTLWAHEMGHVWNAFHVSQNNTYMMNSSVTAVAANVANSTINSITSHKATRNCLDVGPCNNNTCYTNLTNSTGLANNETGIADYESSTYISNTSNVTLQSGARVDYDATTYIQLNPNFTVDAGAIFNAFIDGCNTGQGGVNLRDNGDPSMNQKVDAELEEKDTLGKKYIKALKNSVIHQIKGRK